MTRFERWEPRAERLAAAIEAAGRLSSPELRRAFAQTPRHLFVPTYYRDRKRPVDDSDPQWLDTVYSDEALVTQYRPRLDGSGYEASSSTTMPSLMADMIAELDVRPGMRVLEIGTGTGYNAAILCHLVGDQNVTTIDIDPELVGAARERLASLGYHPSFTPVGDGFYDRVLATHSVRRIPHEWVRWTKPGGGILVDLRHPHQNRRGEWGKLTVEEDSRTATGRLVPARGGFMGARRTAQFVDPGPIGAEATWELLRERASSLPRQVLDDDDFAFFLSWHVTGIEWFDLGSNTNVQAPGDRHADVDDNGGVMYILFGDIWAAVEQAYRAWRAAGEPGIGDWTLLVTEDGRTTLAETADLPVT